MNPNSDYFGLKDDRIIIRALDIRFIRKFYNT